MSWHHKENYDLSQEHPRRQAPKGQGQSTVARIQPLVPEVSVVSHYREARQPLGSLNGQQQHHHQYRYEKSYEDSLCRTIPACAPPQPQQPPLRGEFRPQELSMLNREDISTAESLKRMNLASSHDAQDRLDMSTLESLVKMLRVQAQDIAKLQSQVDYLMNENQKLSGLQQKVDSLMMINHHRPQMVDSSTQMSRPTTPLKKSFNQSQNSILRADGSHLNPSLSFGHVTQNQSLPLTIEPTDKFELQDVDQCNDVDELIANQEQAEEEDEEYDDNPVTPQKLPIEESCIAAKRIRDLGLSFIDKRDLYSTVQSPRKDEPSLWALPHASDPFKMSGPAAPIASTSDYSLMLNDKAMKYLSDEQLVQMAANSPLNQSNSSSLTSRTPVNLTRYGMPENNMSLGTEKFLENYHLRQSRPM